MKRFPAFSHAPWKCGSNFSDTSERCNSRVLILERTCGCICTGALRFTCTFYIMENSARPEPRSDYALLLFRVSACCLETPRNSARPSSKLGNTCGTKFAAWNSRRDRQIRQKRQWKTNLLGRELLPLFHGISRAPVSRIIDTPLRDPNSQIASK